MFERRTAVLFLGVLAVVGTVAGTGGFSAVSADRGVDVRVVDDDRAYLGVDRRTDVCSNGTTNLTVEATNRFATGTTLREVTVAVPPDDAHERIRWLSAGESESVEFENVSADGSVTVHAAGDGVEVSLSREVDC